MARKKEETNIEILFTDSNLDIEETLDLKEAIISSIELRYKLEKLVSDFSEDKPGKLNVDAAKTRKGIAYWMLNRNDEAISLLEFARTSRLTNYFLALCYLENNKPQGAYELIKKLYQEDPNKLYLIIPTVDSLTKKGAVKEAFTILDKAKKTHRGEADLYYYTALCLDYLGEYQKARSEYQHAMRLKPNHPGSLFRLAYWADLHGQDELALSLYEKLQSLRPPYINGLINLGILYEDKSNYAKAMDCYQTILDYYPQHQRAILYLKDAHNSKNMYYNEELKRRERQLDNIMTTPISDFQMSIRNKTSLENLNIKTLGDLAEKSEPELMKCENFGMTSLKELKEILARKGLAFAQPGVSQEAIPRLPIFGGPVKKPDILNKSIFDIDWSARVRSCFGRLKVYTLHDMVNKTEKELLETKNMGQISVKEIKQRLAALGLALCQES